MKTEELSVLLIEDDDIEMGIGLLCLGSAGIKKIDTAENQFQAIRYIQNHKYDLIISDTTDGNNSQFGPDVVRRAKELGQTAVVVGISNYKDNNKFWKGLADYFFGKSEFYGAGLKQVLKERFEVF